MHKHLLDHTIFSHHRKAFLVSTKKKLIQDSSLMCVMYASATAVSLL